MMRDVPDSGKKVWLDANGRPIDESDYATRQSKAREQYLIDETLLAEASVDLEGRRFWYALRTTRCSEIDLAAALVDSRIDAVVPIKSVPACRRAGVRSRKLVHRPVLKGLVFVKLVPSVRAFAGLLRVRGVAALVGSGDHPFPINEKEMADFMDLAQAGAFDERYVPTGIKVGSRVRARLGSGASIDGVLEGYAKTRAARVRTLLFGHQLVVDVKLANLEKLD